MRVQHALSQRLRVADGAQNGSERVGLELAVGQRETDERLDAAPTLTLMCEYILQILLHCGRLRAVVSVRKYLVNAVAELRAREAAEPDE